MARLVLMFYGKGTKPAADMARIRAIPGVKIIDARDPHVVLVEGQAAVKREVKRMENWMVSEETSYEVPSPRPHF